MLPLLAQTYSAKGNARGWLTRRAASTTTSDDGGKGGVSSFAYQGTNSHVTVGAPQHCHALVVCPQRFWDLRKFWFQVRTPPQSISGFRNACVFS